MRRLALTLLVGLLSGAAGAVAPDPPPLRLSTSIENDLRVLRVVGQASVTFSARYELEVTTGASNRSFQRGAVKLSPGEPMTIATVKVAPVESAWSATLRVKPLKGTSYELRLPSIP